MILFSIDAVRASPHPTGLLNQTLQNLLKSTQEGAEKSKPA
jgi:hypothetical protein